MKSDLLMEHLDIRTDAVLILSPENRFYFTGFDSTDGCLIISRSRAVFFTDSRYIEAAQRQIKCCEAIESKDFKTQLEDIIAACGIKTVAVETERMTLAQLERYRKKISGVEFICDGTADKAIAAMREIKSAEELECIKSAQRIAEKAFDYILGMISPDKSEREIALELDYFMLKNGAEAISFETIAVSGANSSMPHGVPSEKKLERGDFLTLDFGAVYKGYHSDMTRTVAIAEVSGEQEKVYNIVLEAQMKSLASLKSGVSCRDADNAAREHITSFGYGEFFSHGTGHGVGVEIHETPNLSPKSESILREGNIVTVEPGIYMPGKFGVRIEDMAYIKEDGCLNLSKAKKELLVI